FTAVGQRDAAAVLQRIDAAVQRGVDASYYLEKCLEHMRQLMIVKTAPESLGLLEVPEPVRVRLTEEAQFFSKQDIFYLFGVLAAGVQQAKRLNIKRVALEMTLLKCTLREPMVLMDEVIQTPASSASTGAAGSSVSAAQRAGDSTSSSTGSAAAARTQGPTAPSASPSGSFGPSASASAPAAGPAQAGISPSEDAGSDTALALEELWASVVRRVQTEKMSAATYLKEANPIDHSKDIVLVGFPEECSFHMEAMSADVNIKLLEKHLSDLLKKDTRVKFVIHGGSDAAGMSSKEIADKNPVLKNAMGIFGGRIIQ
ncbi:MAG: hypothetical protein KBD07_03570, partial [Candidatus Omnitrophica bacterium]|nr:hypothetical protein [Candidatus Omnitrophota bacterium]